MSAKINLENTILNWEAASELAQKCRAIGGVVVSTNGCFDLLHAGHILYLQAARSRGDLLIVGLNSDRSVKNLKGKNRPLKDQLERALILNALRFVDGVCLFDEETPLNWLKTLRPNLHVKGGDYQPEELPEKALVESWGGRIEIIPFEDGFSTSSTIEKIKNSFID